MRKRLIAFGLLGAFCLQLLGCGAGSPAVSGSQASTVAEIGDGRTPSPEIQALSLPELAGMTAVAENDRLALFAGQEDGRVALYVKQTGAVWSSAPLLDETDERLTEAQRRLLSSPIDILYYNAANTEQERNGQIASIGRGGLICTVKDHCLSFVYIFPDDGIQITVEFRLNGDGLAVSVPLDKIVESQGNRLTEISLLPYFGCGTLDDEGYLLVPDGSGALIRMNNGKSTGAPIQEPLYGDDIVVNSERRDALRRSMTLPVLGIRRNGRGLLNIVTEGDAGASVNAYTAGMKRRLNCAYFSFNYRATDSVVLDSSSKKAKLVKMIADTPNSAERFTLRLVPLTGAGDYGEMAARYRTYLTDEQGLQASDTATRRPLYVDCYGALQKQGTVLCVPATVTVPLTTYGQAGEMMAALIDAGIDDVVFSYDGWAQGGVTGPLPTKGKYESRLGGRKAFAALTQRAAALGVTFVPNVGVTDLYTSGNGYSKSRTAAALLNGTPGLQYAYDLSSRLRDKTLTPYYLVSPQQYTGVLQRFFAGYDTTGLSAVGLKKTGWALYSDHHRVSIDRQQAKAMVLDACRYARRQTGGLLTQNANGYTAAVSDWILQAPSQGSGYDIEDGSVPFYALVFSGLKSYSVEATNLSADVQSVLLRAIETGASLSYAFTAQNSAETANTYLAPVYSSDYREWLETAAEQYAALRTVQQATGATAMVAHSRLADGVYETVFANGARVRVNYQKTAYTDAAGTVAAMDYQIIR